MPSTTKKQQMYMSAIAHGWEPSGDHPSKAVAEEFHKADLTKKDKLKKLYGGGQVKRFDGGGDSSGGDTSGDGLDYIDPTATYMTGDNSGSPIASDIAQLTGLGSGNFGVDAPINPGPINVPSSSVNIPSDASSVVNNGSLGSALGNLLSKIGLGGGGPGAVNALAGLLGAVGKYKQNSATMPQFRPPPMFGGTGGGGGGSSGSSGSQFGPAGGYNFRNYQGVGASTPGLGYAPTTQVTPNIPNYYTYGQGGEKQFFAPTGNKKGGRILKKKYGGKVKKFDFGGMTGLLASTGTPPPATAAPLNGPAMNACSVLATQKPTTPAAPPSSLASAFGAMGGAGGVETGTYWGNGPQPGTPEYADALAKQNGNQWAEQNLISTGNGQWAEPTETVQPGPNGIEQMENGQTYNANVWDPTLNGGKGGVKSGATAYQPPSAPSANGVPGSAPSGLSGALQGLMSTSPPPAASPSAGIQAPSTPPSALPAGAPPSAGILGGASPPPAASPLPTPFSAAPIAPTPSPVRAPAAPSPAPSPGPNSLFGPRPGAMNGMGPSLHGRFPTMPQIPRPGIGNRFSAGALPGLPRPATPWMNTQPVKNTGWMSMAQGGDTSGGLDGGGALSSVARHVKGPGDGTSDSIPARLANGEYVMDAQTVSMLGNGDNGSGAKALDMFRENIRKHKGAALAKGQMAPDTHPNLMKYLGGST